MKKETKKRVRNGILIGLVLLLIAAIVFVFYLIDLVRELPRPEKITSFQPSQATKIYDRTGDVLLYEIHGEQNRTLVSSEEIPDHVKQATIALEDQTFYTHAALDWKGILRAVITNIQRGEFTYSGGSTITQQLVKNVFLTPEKTIKRKIKELILSYWIEGQYTKDEILTLYLNQISYGSNSYGVESASQLYFGKSVRDLTIAESAFLASLIQAPSYYSPWGPHLDEALERKDYTLSQMLKNGYIDEEQYVQAKNQELVFQKQNLGSIKAPHFVLGVKDYLVDRYGLEFVENGGLRVITTLDWNFQQLAEESVMKGVQRNSELYDGHNGALVMQDAQNGHILALVGSADYFNETIDGNFNVATQGLRQPGSTFKPLVYLTAFMKGYTPDTIVFDVKTDFNASSNPYASYIPENFDEVFRGPVSLRRALAQSINVPAVKTLYLTGISNVLETAQRMGITTLTNPSQYGLSLVLGGGEVKLIDLIRAYSVFAQDGVLHSQTSILRVEDSNGAILEEYADTPMQVIDPIYIRHINDILTDVQLRSGLFSSSLPLTLFEGYDVALKTGTTNNYKDAWTIGYTPSFVVGVWAGNSNSTPMKQQGGSILAALPMWSSFMNNVIHEFPTTQFPEPEPLTSEVPMLNGNYVYTVTDVEHGETQSFPLIHSILYYIDKDNPQSELSPGFNPAHDPQFYNWEIPVLEWAQKNIPSFEEMYNKRSLYQSGL